MGERDVLEDVQEREEAALPCERWPQHSQGVGPDLLRVRQRHRTLSEPKLARQVPRDDQKERPTEPLQAESKSFCTVHL